MREPLGIDNPYNFDDPGGLHGFSPRISWKICERKQAVAGRESRNVAADGNETGRQIAYRVIVANRPEDLLKNGRRPVWDSDAVKTGRQHCFVPGEIIRPGKTYYWKVGIYHGNNPSCVWSKSARFSTGLLPADWKGMWIRHPSEPKESHIRYRKTFTLPEDHTESGHLYAYVASLGYHELYVNGEKADHRVLAPAVSRIDKRVLYVTYDIGRLVKKGTNVIAVHCGPGWSINNYFARQKTMPGLLVQLYDEEHRFSLSSDSAWLCSGSCSRNAGRFDFMDMGGEQVDGRIYDDRWTKPGFDDSRWEQAAPVEMEDPPLLSSQMTEPSRIVDTIFARSLSVITGPAETDPVYRVDMGRQFTGFLEAGFDGLKEGDTVEIMVSMRTANPSLVQATYGIEDDVIEEQKQRQIYIARGEKGEQFRNRFNFFGGRYIHFRGLRKAPELKDIKGLVISSAPEVTASFECSDSLYNKIFALDVYTYRMCHTEGVVVDCPNRERLGYGPEGAYQTMWGLGLPCFNSSAYYIKNVRDWADVQREDGFINNVAPQISIMYGCVLNGTAILNTAWEHYRIYGDRRILQAAYPVGKKWLGFLDKYMKDSMLTPYDSHGYFLGEWVSPGPVFEYAETEEALFFNNCACAMTLDFMLRIARELDESEADINEYRLKLNALRKALHDKYYHPETGAYQNGDQVRTSFALYAGIVPDELEESVRGYLNVLLQQQQYINVGSFGRYPFYKTVLNHPEYFNIMGHLIAKTTYPGYGYFIEKGCTTMPEMWEIDAPNSTVIHTSYTGISAFFIKTLAGINETGNDTIRIAPAPIERLSRCRASGETPFGRVESAWEKDGNEIIYTFTVPFGMTAKIIPENEEERIVPAGHYRFCYPRK
jgi:alpha-L-rhamnosidase